MTTSAKLHLFVSSVQKELENERIAITELVASDPFLNREVQPILFEELPASSQSPQSAYLTALNECQVYVGILGFEYGRKGPDGLSATHREYMAAQEMGIPTFFFIKGDSSRDVERLRDSDLGQFFETIRHEQSGHVYKRFSNYRQLKAEVRSVLLGELEKQGIRPNAIENAVATHTIAQASDFDSRLVPSASFSDLDSGLCETYAAAVRGVDISELTTQEIKNTLTNRGLLWTENDSGQLRPTTAGILLFGSSPEAFFPQVRIALNAYPGTERGEPIDREDTRNAIPLAVDDSFRFLQRNMRHTVRIEGFTKQAVDEYCYTALREAVVNAVAHRDYDHKGSCIRIEKFADRIEIISPGLAPDPITLDKIQHLDYIACSRNPNLARGLSFFERIEEQGDGLRRIVRETEALGLPRPQFRFRDGHFVVCFQAPEDMRSVRSQHERPLFAVHEKSVAQLNTTEQAILKILLEQKETTAPELAKSLKKAPSTIRKALKKLKEKAFIYQTGKARETTYYLSENPPL